MLVAVAALLAVMVSGCASVGRNIETPRLALIGLTLYDIGLLEQRFGLTFRVQNPNSIVLPIQGVSLALEVDGETFARGVSAERFRVPAYGESEFTMVVSTNLVRSATRLGHLLDPATEAVGYKVEGKVDIDLPLVGALRFDDEGRVPLRQEAPQ